MEGIKEVPENILIFALVYGTLRHMKMFSVNHKRR